MTTRPPAAFYCVTGGDFFPGAVALLNSLRLVGHREPLFVLDAGMQAGQRELLEPHATIVDGPRDAPPSLLKLAARRVHPAGVMALLDADVIVTRPLTEQIEAASRGGLAAFRNDTDRFFAEWGRLLDLGELRRGRYLTSSALFLDAETADEILPLVEDRQRRVDLARTWVGSGSEADPLYFLDQDVINAVVRARLDPGRVVEYDARLAPIPPFNGVRLADETALRCRYDDGAEPHLLHHASRKPWLVTMRSNVYSRLLTRLLFGDDVTLRLDSRHLPLRLRRGTAAGAARLAVDFGVGAPAYARRKLFPRRIRAWQDSR
ncbi:MAG TPA: hypothetical protein VEK39_00280 [Solirubrobacterales bacterium]|nr:hypothetical protein [Solirubrobacterales bacterium]